MNYDEDSTNPVELCKPVEKMKRVYDRLLLLNYEVDFIKAIKIRPIHRLYFINPTNPGEQFHYFASISAWLIRKCGRPIEMPQESDDPNRIITSILDHVRNLGGSVNFTPNRIKSGSGPDVLIVLDFLTSSALKSNKIEWKRPEIKLETKDEEEEEDEQEVNLDKIEEEMDELYTSEEDDNDTIFMGGFANNGAEEQVEQKILESDTDAEYWRLELERVLPQLKITVNTDLQDWRLRQDQMKSYTNSVTEVKQQILTPLEKIISNSTSISEKVQNREVFLNSKFDSILQELSESQKKLAEGREKLRTQSSELGGKNKILNQLNEDLELTRKSLEDRGSIMADGAPVVAVRKALLQLKKDVSDMEVEIGVMQHYIMKSLLQEQRVLRDKSM